MKAPIRRSDMRMEAEFVQLRSQTRLIDEITADGVSLALPLHDDEHTDWLAYLSSSVGRWPLRSVPIKVKNLGTTFVASDLERERASGLLVVTVCEVADPSQVRSFAFTPAELMLVRMVGVIGAAGGPQFPWDPEDKLAPSRAFRSAIKPYAMSPGKWREKIVALLKLGAVSSY
jgi:hypothetical protein